MNARIKLYKYPHKLRPKYICQSTFPQIIIAIWKKGRKRNKFQARNQVFLRAGKFFPFLAQSFY